VLLRKKKKNVTRKLKRENNTGSHCNVPCDELAGVLKSLWMEQTCRVVGANETSGTWFENTDWWVVHQAGRPENPQADPARSILCREYWNPVFYQVLRSGYRWHDAQDLTQEFFSRLLKQNSLRDATSEKGKFRSFLLTLLKRFLADQRDREQCQKRGGGAQVISLNEGDTEFRRRNEPVSELDPEMICERQWVESVLEGAFAQLEREFAADGKEEVFRQLKLLLTGEGDVGYAAAAKALQLSEANMRVMVHRLRRRLRKILDQGCSSDKGRELLAVYANNC
jgi:RNA polymerase sigma-70 factor (ECF subfamily)